MKEKRDGISCLFFLILAIVKCEDKRLKTKPKGYPFSDSLFYKNNDLLITTPSISLLIERFFLGRLFVFCVRFLQFLVWHW